MIHKNPYKYPVNGPVAVVGDVKCYVASVVQ